MGVKLFFQQNLETTPLMEIHLPNKIQILYNHPLKMRGTPKEIILPNNNP